MYKELGKGSERGLKRRKRSHSPSQWNYKFMVSNPKSTSILPGSSFVFPASSYSAFHSNCLKPTLYPPFLLLSHSQLTTSFPFSRENKSFKLPHPLPPTCTLLVSYPPFLPAFLLKSDRGLKSDAPACVWDPAPPGSSVALWASLLSCSPLITPSSLAPLLSAFKYDLPLQIKSTHPQSFIPTRYGPISPFRDKCHK